MGPRPQGLAWPNKKHLQSPDMVKVLQTKMDQSSGLDKGSCVACLLCTGVGCPIDSRVGCEGKCGHSHQGPKGRIGQYCKDVVKTCGFDSPVYFNNPKFLAKSKPTAGSPKQASSASDEDDDDDHDDGE